MREAIPVFIINLKQDKKKREHIERICRSHQLNFEIIDAVYGKNLSEEYIETIYDATASLEIHGRELTKGELGCALSHISIYQKMLQENINMAIIFEDDIELTENFDLLLSSVESFPKNWELMLLGYYSRVAGELKTKSSLRYRKKIAGNLSAVRLVQLAYGAHGYMINLQGAKRLLNEFKSEKIKQPIDHYTGHDQYINLYAVSPRVVKLSDKFKEASSLELERKDLRSKRKLMLLKKSFKSKLLHRLGIVFLVNRYRLFLKQIKKIEEY